MTPSTRRRPGPRPVPGAGTTLRPAEPFAYGVLVSAGPRTFATVVVRRWDGERVRTVAAVTSPPALAGSTVTVDEGPGTWACQVRLPTMDRPRDILGRDQYAALPMVDLGYLDLSVASHPRLRADDDGMLVDADLGVSVSELVDSVGRVTERVVRRPGAADRAWTSTYPDPGRPDAAVPTSGTIRWGDDDQPTSLSRVFHLPEPPPSWSDPGTWADADRRAERVELVRSLPGGTAWPS